MTLRNLSFLLVVSFLVFLLSSGCLLSPVSGERAILRGSAAVPASFRAMTNPLSGATVEIIDPETGDVIATTTTDENGNYEVEVPPGGPYLVRIQSGEMVLLDVSPSIEPGRTYNLGTADASSTAVALVFMVRVGNGENPASINLEEIAGQEGIENLTSAIEAALLAGSNPLTSSEVLEELEGLLPPEGNSNLPSSENANATITTGDGYGTITITIQRSRLIPQEADSILFIIRDATRKIVQTVELPEGKTTLSTSFSVPVSTYDVYVFSMMEASPNLGHWALTSGKSKGVVVEESKTTEVSITLQPFSASFSITPENVTSGGVFTVEATVRGAGVEIWNEPFFDRMDFVYDTSSWSFFDSSASGLTSLLGYPTRTGEDEIKATFTVNAPLVSADTTLYYRIVLYAPVQDFLYLALPDSCGELLVTTGRTGTLQIVVQ